MYSKHQSINKVVNYDVLLNSLSTHNAFEQHHEDVVVVLGFYVSPTAEVTRRLDLGIKSHPKDWRSPGSNSLPLN